MEEIEKISSIISRVLQKISDDTEKNIDRKNESERELASIERGRKARALQQNY